MMKSKNLSLLLSVAFAFVLSACSQLALPGKEKPAPVTEKVAENAELKAISDSAKSLPSFIRSEEHTSELQSRFDLVCRLLLEKKKKNQNHYEIVLILK